MNIPAYSWHPNVTATRLSIYSMMIWLRRQCWLINGSMVTSLIWVAQTHLVRDMRKESGNAYNISYTSRNRCCKCLMLCILDKGNNICVLMFFNRADVLITQPIEVEWKKRRFEALDKVKWTYVGLRSGVFRTYPGHRSGRSYDPTA